MFTRSDELPEGVTRLPIKTIHVNKSPIVIGNLKTLSDATAAALGPRPGAGAAPCRAIAARRRTCWPACGRRSSSGRRAEGAADVDEDLYGGFVGNEDRRTLQRLRALSARAAGRASAPAFDDPRLDELLFRYRARNFPETLDRAEQRAWQRALRAPAARRRRRRADAGRPSSSGSTRWARTPTSAAQEILGALVDYATEIAPELD